MEGQGLEAFCRARRDEGDGDVRQGFAALNMHESLGMTREEVALALIMQESQNQRRRCVGCARQKQNGVGSFAYAGSSSFFVSNPLTRRHS